MDFGVAFGDTLVALLEATPFSNVQQLRERLASLTGLSPGAIDFDPTTRELTFHLGFVYNVDGNPLLAGTQPLTTALAFPLDLSPIADIRTSTMLALDAGITGDLVLGIDLDFEDNSNPMDLLFLKDVLLTGSVQLSISDLNASASLFDFINVGVVNGQGIGRATDRSLSDRSVRLDRERVGRNWTSLP